MHDAESDALSVVPESKSGNDETMDVHALLDEFRTALREKYSVTEGIFGLKKYFRSNDIDQNKSLDNTEFDAMLNALELGWSIAQRRIIFSFFDRRKEERIEVEDFINVVRGQLNSRRKQLVLAAFKLFDANGNGVIEKEDVMTKYSARRHPEVLVGNASEDQIFSSFLDVFDANHDETVSVQEFCDYYACLSAVIDNDDYFELMIRNAWHISGGRGWAANSTCLRVLVRHVDGHESVQEIKNDLGLDVEDIAVLRANLEAQGITDLAGIYMKHTLHTFVDAALKDISAPPSTPVPTKLVPSKDTAASPDSTTASPSSKDEMPMAGKATPFAINSTSSALNVAIDPIHHSHVSVVGDLAIDGPATNDGHPLTPKSTGLILPPSPPKTPLSNKPSAPMSAGVSSGRAYVRGRGQNHGSDIIFG